MLLQSNEGKIRIFPAVPSGWTPAFKLLARGAFIVTSKMKDDGSIPGVQIESLKGNTCKIVNPWGEQAISVLKTKNKNLRVNHKIINNNCIEFQTEEGESYLIIPQGMDIEEPEIFKSDTNNAPKQFLDAEIGKQKNF